MTAMPHRKRPCAECPWRKDTEPGQFPAERYEALQNTAGLPGNEARLNAPMFGCHKSTDAKQAACAGWLSAIGYDHLGVRLAIAMGELPASAIDPGEDWPELFETYAEMAQTQGDRE